MVENAIYHGVKLRAEAGGQICIRAWYKDNDLYVEVADNGPGVSPNKLLKLHEELTLGVGMSGIHGYGLHNVHTRLRLHYGEPYGLLLESKEGTSFIAYMHLPIELGKAYEQNDFIDDDAILRRAICQAVDWAANGIDLIGMAKDSIEGLELIAQHRRRSW